MADSIQFHPAANIFPLLEGEELSALAENIKERGLQKPIELLDGKIIDGRNRKTACLMAGVEPEFITIKTDDPMAYVLSANLHRRQLDQSQKAMVAGRARDWYDKRAAERKTAGQKAGGHARHEDSSLRANLPHSTDAGRSRDKAAQAVGVGGRTVDYATRVLKKGTQELVDAVDSKQIAVSTAARIAELPVSQQKEIIKGERPIPKDRTTPDEIEPGKFRGVGVLRANEAIDALKRIPKNDPLRKRGFQIVTDWIKANK